MTENQYGTCREGMEKIWWIIHSSISYQECNPWKIESNEYIRYCSVYLFPIENDRMCWREEKRKEERDVQYIVHIGFEFIIFGSWFAVKVIHKPQSRERRSILSKTHVTCHLSVFLFMFLFTHRFYIYKQGILKLKYHHQTKQTKLMAAYSLVLTFSFFFFLSFSQLLKLTYLFLLLLPSKSKPHLFLFLLSPLFISFIHSSLCCFIFIFFFPTPPTFSFSSDLFIPSF